MPKLKCNFTVLPVMAAIISFAGVSASLAADFYDPAPTAKGPVGVLERPRREYDAIGYRSGNLIFYPTLLTSATYDDNIFATRFNKVSDLVFHIVPTISVSSNLGTTAVSGYVTADARISTQRSELNAIAPGVGIGFKSELQRDLIVQGRADYAYRVEDAADANRQAGVNIIRENVRYHDFTSNVSINKSFNQFYVSAGAAYEHLAFDNVTAQNGVVVNESLRDADLVNWTLRGGYQFGPGLRVFVEPSYNIRRYQASGFNSDGYRLVAGLSANLGRLVTGEIFAGYMQQNYNFNFGSVGGFAAGANLRWYPTDLLTVSLSADRSIRDVGIATGVLRGSPAFVNTIAVRADYELFRNLILSGRLGYQTYDYQRNLREVSNFYTAGLTGTYLINRFLTSSLDYTYSVNDSNVPLNRYTRNQVTLSLKTKF